MKFTHGGQVLNPELWADLPWLHLGCTTRKFPSGAPQPDGPTHEARGLLDMIGLREHPMFRCFQQHTKHVVVVQNNEHFTAQKQGYFAYPNTDAMVCVEPQNALVIYTADCVPIMIVDTRTRATAAIHSGWKGTLTRIAERTVQTLCDCGSRPQDLRAWIGPCASGAYYEVSPELIDEFHREFAHDNVQFANGRLLNLPALVAYQLRRAGMTAQSIVNSNICTIARHTEFPSYRKRANDNEKARIISFIATDTPT